MARGWVLPMLLVVGGLVLAIGQIATGAPGVAAVFLVAFVLLAGLHSPLAFPRSIGAVEAQRRSAADDRPRSRMGARTASPSHMIRCQGDGAMS
ncbi:hypothetical protein [Nonomuraea sp. NPDC049480]|uniref:hypothetical protein n=1 Tax=Nonomuraea sp. NPDC049480 TaxID=3364353 RepID=UPI0037B6B839